MSSEDKKVELSMKDAQISWSKEKFRALVHKYGISREWEPELPEKGEAPVDCPEGKICLYEAYFQKGLFRLPVSRFFISVLQRYGVHVSQMSPFGVMRVMHFEATCRALRRQPVFEHFNVFYKLEVKESGWVSFVERSKSVSLIVPKSSPKTLRDWKRCFFFVKKEVIPVEMTKLELRPGQKVPSFEVVKDFQEEAWFQELSAHPSRLDDLDKLDEGIMRLLGLSRLGVREGYNVAPAGDGGALS